MNEITEVELEMLRKIQKGQFVSNSNAHYLIQEGLAFMDYDEDSKPFFATTLKAERLLAQASEPQPDTGAAGVSDGVAVARAQIARLRGALETIRDYPTVESDMDIGHQVAGMVIQAEVALDEVPSNSGLLTILTNKLTAKQAELETTYESLNSCRNEIADLRTRLAAAEGEAARYKVALEAIKDETIDAQGEWASVDPVYQPVHLYPITTIESLAAVALATAATLTAGCKHEHSTTIVTDNLSGDETWKRRCNDCGHVWEDN